MNKPNQTKLQETPDKKKYVYAHGRRKEATARVRLYSGKGESIINDKPLNQFFTSETDKLDYLKPFLITQTQDKYYTTIKVTGSGKKSQLGAVIHGVSRALNTTNDKHHPLLKNAGLLTRDSRVKERRKYGKAQKARKGKQSPKR